MSPVLVVALACLGMLCLGAAAVRFDLVCPSWVSWQERTIPCDLDGDGSAETVRLHGRRVTVSDASGSGIYQSDGTWRVADVLVGDVTGDGLDDLAMIVWRRGNYGTSRPFWDTGIDLRMTQHLYVMGLREGTMHPVWMSHELGDDLQVESVSCPAPGQVELVTRQGARSTWEWNTFGFWRDV